MQLFKMVPFNTRNDIEPYSNESLCWSDTDSQIETDEEMESKPKVLGHSVNINDDSWNVVFQPDRELKPTASQNPFTCEVCEFNKENGGVLRSHLTTYSDEEPYTCEACNFKSAYKEDLESHLKTFCKLKRFRLNIIKPCICDICDFRCAQKRGLDIHARTHTVEKPFTCQVCNFRSAHKEDLRSHLKTFCKQKMNLPH